MSQNLKLTVYITFTSSSVNIFSNNASTRHLDSQKLKKSQKQTELGPEHNPIHKIKPQKPHRIHYKCNIYCSIMLGDSKC